MKIEKGVPMPKSGRKKYPFGQMEVGDSFYTENHFRTVAPSACGYGQRHGKKFSVRKEGEGTRCWRIA